MIKILPILIIPLFFLIVYLGVENLTRNNFENEAKDKQIKQTHSEENENKTFSKNKVAQVGKSEIENKAENQKSNLTSEKKSINSKDNNIEINQKKKEEKISNQTNNDLIKKEGLEKNKKKSIKEIKKLDRTLVQFGAFSRKDYAENSKKEIEKKIKKKFENVNLNIDFVKDRKLYRLLYVAEDKDLAKLICEFSKNVKINCLIKSK